MNSVPKALFPTKAWGAYEKDLKALGEHRFGGTTVDLQFLRALGFVRADDQLTDAGETYFVSKHIRGDDAHAESTVRAALIDLESASAILQLLGGLGRVPRARAETVLRSQRLTSGLTERSLGALLALLNHFRLIRYAKGDGSLEVLAKPQTSAHVPRSVFISPETPYGNRVWLRRVLEQCDEYIYWLDKHFKAIAFEPLWEAADRSRISDIRILSLQLPDNTGRRPLREYTDLRRELVRRGIALEWRFIEPSKIRDTHDRWIIGKSTARNVPDVGSIFSGSHSELNISDQAAILRELFLRYWTEAATVERRASNEAA